ncbi:MAG: alpha/beta hydrolase [Sphingomonas sp.]|nr:alpha/beta hydrolase [Sphingomonas sp.]
MTAAASDQKATQGTPHLDTRGGSSGISKTQIRLAAGALALAGAAALLNRSNAKRVEGANPPRGNAIKVDGVILHHVDSGTPGPVVLLLHGNGTTLEDWFACGIFEELSKTNRVIAFDRPGFGYSTRPRARLWTPAAQADLLALALRSLGADDLTVVGHSFGTLVSIELARRHPELVHALVLMSGYYYPSARADVLIASIPAIPIVGDIDRHTVGPVFGAALRPAVERKLFAPAAVASSWRKFPFEMTLRPSQLRAEAAEAALMVPTAARMAPDYAELTIPVQIISGEGDRVANHARQSARFAAELASAKLTTLRGVGHMVHHTAAERVLHAIRQAMSEESTIEE